MESKFNQSTLIDVKKIVDDCKEKWINYNLSEVNDCIIRLGIVKGEFHWHKHDEEDEFFFVLQGKLLLDLESETIELSPWQGYTVPKQIVHRTRASKKTVMLMMEKSSVNPKGD
jgi:mannose-6-phosphate isomerase-like protein (cupin superfamily)